jgi:hypothetical protein
MNTNDDNAFALLERELRSLQPVAPDAEVVTRLHRRMSTTQPLVVLPRTQHESQITEFRASGALGKLPAWKRVVPWAAAAAVTAAATAPHLWRNLNSTQAQSGSVSAGGSSSADTRAIRPVRHTQAVNYLSDEGVIIDPAGLHQPNRALKVRYNNNVEVRDVQNEMFLRYEYPSEETMVIPARFH